MSGATPPQEEHGNGGDVGSSHQDSTKELTDKEASKNEKDTENEGEDKESNDIPGFDDNATYFALFCTTEVPDEYFQAVANLTDEGNLNDCLEITSSNPTNTLDEIKENIVKHQRPHPFLNNSLDDIYTFFKSHIRPDLDYSGPGMHFSSFTFLLVDAACLASSPWHIKVCCDAPDYGEKDEIVLKTLQLPLEEAMENLCALETFSLSPSEVGHPSGLSLSIQPPPSMVTTETPGLYRVATAGQARANKARAIRGLGDSADEVFGAERRAG